MLNDAEVTDLQAWRDRPTLAITSAQRGILDRLPKPYKVQAIGGGWLQVYVYGERNVQRKILNANGRVIESRTFEAGDADHQERERLMTVDGHAEAQLPGPSGVR